MQKENYDVIVLGGGKGGKTLAITLAKAGKKTALIEKEMIGGSCINVACIPTKTMIHSAKIADLAKKAEIYGIEIEGSRTDLTKVTERKRSVVKEMSDANLEQFLHTQNLDFFLGTGRFIGEKTIEVTLKNGEKNVLEGKHIVINTGSRPSIPPIEGIDNVPFLTSQTMMELSEIPSHLIVIGGGYIGLEFAQMFHRFGSKVTLVHHGDQLLAREDQDVAETIKALFEKEGIEVYLSTKPLKVLQKGKEIRLEAIKKDGQKLEWKASHLLVATGRIPNTEQLNLDATGVKRDEKGFIQVNENLVTSNPSIWALGDVNGGPQFTHVSLDDFRIARSQLIGGPARCAKERLIPYTLFIDPQLGRVGLTEKEALKRGYSVGIAKLPMHAVPRAKTMEERKGFLKVVVDTCSHQILGCALLCAEAGELLGTLQVAMIGKIPYTTLRDTIFAHPTLVESLNMVFEKVQEPILLSTAKL